MIYYCLIFSSEEYALPSLVRWLCYCGLYDLCITLHTVHYTRSQTASGKPAWMKNNPQIFFHTLDLHKCVRSWLNMNSVLITFMWRFLSLQRFSRFCLENYDLEVCEDDQREFLNGWYFMVIISDVLTIIGSILKMEIQAKVSLCGFSFTILMDQISI